MPRSLLNLPLLLCLPLALAACGDDTATPTGPDAPAPTSITETFTGAINRNGATTSVFVANTGSITATLTTVTPSAAVVGFALGEWNATTELCQLRLTNDDATQGKVIVAAAQVTSNYCLRVYDSKGNLSDPVAFEVTVVHF